MITTAEFARQIRLRALRLCFNHRTSHIGGSLSVADILAVLYNETMNIAPDRTRDPDRDRLFYSKGHACAALYAALDISGFFPAGSLQEKFAVDGSYYTSHINHNLPGIELSTGSLGHALGVACGSALAAKRRSGKHRVFAVLSDGELDEGSNWEAILFAAHNRLDNLVAVIDYNKIQGFGTVAQIMAPGALPEKLRAFNWPGTEVDGHSLPQLCATLAKGAPSAIGRPRCVIAHTTKGKGVSFMEDQLAWHYRSPSAGDYEAALQELDHLDA